MSVNIDNSASVKILHMFSGSGSLNFQTSLTFGLE